jgi:hypothetical protein
MSKKKSGRVASKRKSSRRGLAKASSMVLAPSASLDVSVKNTSSDAWEKSKYYDTYFSNRPVNGSWYDDEDEERSVRHESGSDSGGEWITAGSTRFAVFNFSVPYKKSYKLHVPSGVSSFNVITPVDLLIGKVSLTFDVLQLAGVAPLSVFAGSQNGKSEIKIVNSDLFSVAVVGDTGFADFSYVQEVELKGIAYGFDLALSGEAQSAGIVEIEGSDFDDKIDASSYTVAIEIDGEDGADSLSGGTQGDKLDGGDGVDALQGNDGADVYEGGKGGDSLNLSDSDNAVDTIVYKSRFDGSSAAVAGGLFDGFDVVTGFDVDGTDRLLFKFAPTGKVNGAVDAAFDFLNVDTVVTSLAGALPPAVYAPGAAILFALNNGVNTGLYAALLANTDSNSATGEVVASGVTYLAQFSGAVLAI